MKNPFENIHFVPKIPNIEGGRFECVDCGGVIRTIGNIQDLVARKVDGVRKEGKIVCRQDFLQREKDDLIKPPKSQRHRKRSKDNFAATTPGHPGKNFGTNLNESETGLPEDDVGLILPEILE